MAKQSKLLVKTMFNVGDEVRIVELPYGWSHYDFFYCADVNSGEKYTVIDVCPISPEEKKYASDQEYEITVTDGKQNIAWYLSERCVEKA